MFKKAIGLFILASMSAVAMPTAASGEGETTSGSITVGVEITDENEPCDGLASIGIVQQEGASGRLELSYETTREPYVSLYGLITSSLAEPWEFSFVDYERVLESFQGTLASGLDPSDLDTDSLIYADSETVEGEDFQPHPADLNSDGVIDLIGDVPPIMRESVRVYTSEEFLMDYDSGACSSESIVGAVDVTRTGLTNEIEGTDAELSDFYGPVPEDAKGLVLLIRETEFNNENPVSNIHAVFPYANDPEVPRQFIDYVSFGETGQELFYAEMSLMGEYFVGNYQTEFTFNLEVGTYDYFETANTSICKFLNPNWEQGEVCFGL